MLRRSARKLLPYVVALLFIKKDGASTGTGTIINQNGFILTANHVVPPDGGWVMMIGRNYKERLPEMYTLGFQIVARFPEHDIAIIKSPDLPLDQVRKPVEFLFQTISYGQLLGSYGYPRPYISQEWMDKEGEMVPLVSVEMLLRFKSYFVAGTGPDLQQEEPGPPQSTRYMLDSFSYGGHSGGPVFDVEGRIVAVMSSAHLDKTGKYEISYCEASAVSNVQKELLAIQRS